MIDILLRILVCLMMIIGIGLCIFIIIAAFPEIVAAVRIAIYEYKRMFRR